MQEVIPTTTSAANSFDAMRTSAVLDASSQARAFSDFMNLANPSAGTAWFASTGKAATTASTGSSTAAASTGAAGTVSTVAASAGAAVSGAVAAAGSAAASGGQAVQTATQTVSQAVSQTVAQTTGQATPQSRSAQTAAPTAASAGQTAPLIGTTVGNDVQSLFAKINATQTNVAPEQPLVQSDMSTTMGTTVSTGKVSKSSKTPANAKQTALNTARNTKVSRESFTEAKPLLAQAGLSQKEISDLSERVQSSGLTWGQLVQTLAQHTTGAKQSVNLTDSDKQNLQSMFQKLGFDSSTSTDLTKAMGQGEGLRVLSALQNKLANTQSDNTPGLSKDEIGSFCKALKVPEATATALAQKLSTTTATVADAQSALTTIGQAIQELRAQSSAKDAQVAQGLAKIMDKDVAKNERDATGTTTASGTSKSSSSSGSAGGTLRYDLKTKDRNDTSWFDDHEKNQQQASDDSWKNFLGKVREDTAQQQSATGTANGTANGAATATATATAAGSQTAQAQSASAKSAGSGIDQALTRAAQTMTSTPQNAASATQQSAAYQKTTAPKVLDQVTQAMLKDLGQGRKQLTMDLDPENLGKVQVVLQVKGKEVNAVIHAEDSGTAAMLNSNMEGLRKSLEDKGLTVQNMEVHSGLASRQDQQQTSFNAEQHNQQAQEQQDMSRVLSQLRMLRSDSGDAMSLPDSEAQAILADQGLHLIA